MGSALGTIPTVHIALSERHSAIRGIILLSPLNSKEFKLDIFDSLAEVKCPTLLIHGKQDQLTPFKKSSEMIEKIKYAFEWFPSKGTHNNLTTKFRTKLLGKIKFFLEHLNYQTQKKQIDIQNSMEVFNISIMSKTKADEKHKSNKFLKIVIVANGIPETPNKIYCLSLQKDNTMLENTELAFSQKIRPSVEMEGEYIFSEKHSGDERNYYNSQDARDLEFEFRKIQNL
jgi:hypothetical protein